MSQHKKVFIKRLREENLLSDDEDVDSEVKQNQIRIQTRVGSSVLLFWMQKYLLSV